MSKMVAKSKPTLKQLYFVLGKNSYLWRPIGTRLKFDCGDLNNIEEEFKMRGRHNNSRCMIELFNKWLMKNDSCTWEVIIAALDDLKESKLRDKIIQYSIELKRIKNYPLSSRCKIFYPHDDFCYEEQELGKSYFETDTLAWTEISDYKESVIEYLRENSTLWYEMGLFMGLSKEELDQIDQLKNPSPERALRVMFEKLIEAKAFSLTWRVVIDALLDMELNEIAEAIHFLASNHIKFPGITTIAPTRMRRCNFEGIGRQSEKFKDEVKKSQEMYAKKIRKILHVREDVSDEDLVENIKTYIVKENPSISGVKEVAENLKKIGKGSIELSEYCTETAEALLKDLDTTKGKINFLKKEKVNLLSSKRELQLVSKNINSEISKLNNSVSDDTKVRLQHLERESQNVIQQLEGVYERLKACIFELDKANSDYESICQRLHELNDDLKKSKKILSALLSNSDCDGFSVLLEVEENMKGALAAIELTDKRIKEVEDSLNDAEHPYVNELKQVDPYRCTVEGEGAKRAKVGVTAIAILQTRNFAGEQCKANKDEIDCNIVSRITGASIRCDVQIQNENECEIKYVPIIKGLHQLYVKVDGNDVGSQPFQVAVRVEAPVNTLRDPILSIDQHLISPREVAVNEEGEIFVTVDGGIAVFSPDCTYIRSIGNGGNYIGIVIDNHNNIIVTDIANRCIKKFSKFGNYLGSFGSWGSDPRQFQSPRSVAFNNNLYVSDWSSRIQVLTSGFSYLHTTTLSRIGKGDKYIACDNAGLIYLAKYCGQIVEIMTPGGSLKNQIANDQWEIRSIAVDKDGHLYVADGKSCCIYVYSSSGEFVKTFGKGALYLPNGITVDNYGVVYVCDHGTGL